MKKFILTTIIILTSFLFIPKVSAETSVSYGTAEQWFFWGQTGCKTSYCSFNPAYSDRGFSNVNSQYEYFDYATGISIPGIIGTILTDFYGPKMLGLRVNNVNIQSQSWYKVLINLQVDSSAGPWEPFDFSSLSRNFNVALNQNGSWVYNLTPNRSISGNDYQIVVLFKAEVSSSGFLIEIGNPRTSTIDNTLTTFQCNGYDQTTGQLIGGCGIKIKSIEVYLTDSINAELEDLNNTQKETNNKLDDLNQTQQETNNQLNDLNNNINNDNTDEATNEASEFFSSFQTDTFGLTSIITAPLTLIQSITSTTCSPLGLPLPYVDETLNLPCLSSIYEEYFGVFLDIYQTITFGIVAYWVCVRIFNLVKDFKNPEHDEIEVLDL